MRISPRDELLRTLRSVANVSYEHHDRRWTWDGRDGSNSVSDAQQLLCLILPMAMLPQFRVERPADTEEALANAVRALGSRSQIPITILGAFVEYLERYSDSDGRPVFSGGARLKTDDSAGPTPEQRSLDLTESFAVSIKLTLAGIGMAKVFQSTVPGNELLERLFPLAHGRLTAAMVGLLRSFAVSVFDINSQPARELIRTVNPSGHDAETVARRLGTELRETAIRLAGLDVGLRTPPEIADRNTLFECGWSWGICADAPDVRVRNSSFYQQPGYALAAPYLHATAGAVDAIQELESPRTTQLRLLQDEQVDLANALVIRSRLAVNYWSTVAALGRDRWPIEDIPWQATDGQVSDLFSLLLIAIAGEDVAHQGDANGDRLERILAELAVRARITRRASELEPGVALHHPGARVRLHGSGLFGPTTAFVEITTFAHQLYKQTLRIANLARTAEPRRRLLTLADEIWRHLHMRSIDSELRRVDLWDQPGNVFPSVPRFDKPGWEQTLSVVESLIVATELVEAEPPPSPDLYAQAQDLLAEAEHLFDQALLAGSADRPPTVQLHIEQCGQEITRARGIMTNRPGTAVALLLGVLRELHQQWLARTVWEDL